jgi:hypothetical protein
LRPSKSQVDGKHFAAGSAIGEVREALQLLAGDTEPETEGTS